MANETPKVDELEKGPWPSYVKELKRAAKKNAAARTYWAYRNCHSKIE